MWSREARFWTHSIYYHPIPYVGIVFFVSVNLQKICATLWDRTWHFGSCVSHLWDCGRWSPSSTHTVLLTIPQTREQLPGPSKVREAPFLLCVCMRGRQTERHFYKELSQNPKTCSWQAGNPGKLMVQFQSESQKVEIQKIQCFNWVWKEEKKKKVSQLEGSWVGGIPSYQHSFSALFYWSLQLIGWGLPILGKAICFTQYANSKC